MYGLSMMERKIERPATMRLLRQSGSALHLREWGCFPAEPGATRRWTYMSWSGAVEERRSGGQSADVVQGPDQAAQYALESNRRTQNFCGPTSPDYSMNL